MFGLGIWEILVIVAVVVIFVRPSDLPSFLRGLGRSYKRFRDLYRGVTRMISDIDTGIYGSTGTFHGSDTVDPSSDANNDGAASIYQSHEKEGS